MRREEMDFHVVTNFLCTLSDQKLDVIYGWGVIGGDYTVESLVVYSDKEQWIER